MSEKSCRTNWLIQSFFCLQVAFSHSSRRVQCFRPYSALDFLEFAKASPSKTCLDYERNHSIKNLGIGLVG